MGGSASGANHSIDNRRHRLTATIRRIVMVDDAVTIIPTAHARTLRQPSDYHLRGDLVSVRGRSG
jgi:hypothetical protein